MSTIRQTFRQCGASAIHKALLLRSFRGQAPESCAKALETRAELHSAAGRLSERGEEVIFRIAQTQGNNRSFVALCKRL